MAAAAPSGVILALDPGTTNLGYALMRVPDQWLLAAGSVTLCASDAAYPQIAQSACVFLESLYGASCFGAVVVETQLRDRMIAVMQSIVCWCVMRSVPCDVVAAQTWRKRVGARATGNYDRNKAASMEFARDVYSHRGRSSHECEAVLMAVGACAEFSVRLGEVPSE